MSTFQDQIWRSAPNIQNSNLSASGRSGWAVTFFLQVDVSSLLGDATAANLN